MPTISEKYEQKCEFLHIDVQQKDYYQHLFNIPDPESCHEKCLEHDSCEFFVWISPDYSVASYHYNCFLKWGNLSPPIDANTALFSNYKDCHSCITTKDSEQTQRYMPCVFPFTYDGITHTACTYYGGYSTPWCSTKTDENGLYQSGQWGYCDMDKCTSE